MKGVFAFVVGLILLSVCTFAQPPDTIWTRFYGGPEYDECNSVQQTMDGGFILAGMTSSFGAGGRDMYLVRTDSLGDTLWTRTYGGVQDDQANSVQLSFDGGYIIGGSTQSFGAGECDFYLVRTDANGDTLWTKTYGSGGRDECNSVQQVSDGGIVLAGCGNSDMYLVRTDSVGDTIWTRSYGTGLSEVCYCVQQTNDGGYILGGTINQNDGDIYVLKTDSVGNVIWTRTFGGPNHEGCTSLVQTGDGCYVLAGTKDYYTGHSLSSMFLLKIDSNGDSLWVNYYGQYNTFCNSVKQTTDGGYILGGYGGNGGEIPQWRSVVVKTDTLGTQEWVFISDTLTQKCNSVLQISDSCYILGGFIWPWHYPITDMYLTEFTPNGNVFGIPIDDLVITLSSNTNITLSWSTLMNALSYHIYKSTVPGAEFGHIGSTSDTAYVDVDAVVNASAGFYYVTTDYGLPWWWDVPGNKSQGRNRIHELE
jgi:hypothetical protein